MKYGLIRCKIVIAFLFSLGLLCLPSISSAANIEGRVFNEAGPMKGAKVYVYKEYADIKGGAAFLTSGASDGQGRYKLQVPEGEYYFTAAGSSNGKNFFSYLGGNPVKVSNGNMWVAFMANETRPPSYTNGESSVRGLVTYKGKPVKGAVVAFYTSENRKFKGLGFKTESVKEDGTFNFPLPPNNYVIIARKKEEGSEIGPLRNGDLYCYFPGNPIEIKPDKIAQIKVPCYPKVERTSFVGSPVIKTNDFPTVEQLAATSKFGIKGRVTDDKGNAVKEIYVLAYQVDPANTRALAKTFRGVHGTENVGKTDERGNYFIPLEADGSYAVMARYILGGGTPKGNEVYGFYNNTNRKGISFKKGQIIDDINIVVVTPSSENDPQVKNGKIR